MTQAQPIQVQPSQEFNIKVTAQELDFIGQALHELPGKICNPLWQKINQQVMTQVAPSEGKKAGGEQAAGKGGKKGSVKPSEKPASPGGSPQES
jgi:hypothetical protein